MPRRAGDQYDGESPYNAPATGLISSFAGEHSFLSNFYFCPFDVKGVEVKTAEHAFQAQKTLDREWRARILDADSPGEAKQLGRECPMRPGWEEGLRVQVMREILRWKFPAATMDTMLPFRSGKLMATGDKHLVEGNKHGDAFWGCVHPTEGSNLWVGRNMLGILLMERRTQLQHEICI